MKTAGVVFDFYDDPAGSLLKKTFPTAEELPEIVKTAHILSSEERDVLRDEAFALIMLNEGKTLRKFACVDPGNTFLSALYFIENRDKLPEEAEKVAAANLSAACEEFNLPFSEIVKEAMKTAPQRTRDPMKQPTVGDESDWAARTNLLSIQGNSDSGRVVQTTSSMKTAEARMVDVTGLEPKKVIKTAQAKHMALDRYPLDSFADVKKAVEYFSETYTEMSPEDRHHYSVKTAARAVELGIQVPEIMERYGSVEYSPDVEAHLAHRRSMVDEEFHEVYDALQEKRASIEPAIFARLLAEADEASGLSWLYPRVSDPYFATFGGNSAKEKLASWSWESPDGQSVNAAQLQELADNRRPSLESAFSSDVADEFAKDPVTIFDSMPDPQKAIIASLATKE
jgi:hypothetical protein